MTMKFKVWSLVVVTLLGVLQNARAGEAGGTSLRKAAIIVENRAGAQLNDKVGVLEDLLTSRVAGKGFSLISRDAVINALNAHPSAGATKLDELLADQTSALRLAQNLGADFILIPSITTYGTEKKSYTGNGIATLNITHTLRVSYTIVEAGEGGAIKGAEVVVHCAAQVSVEKSDSTIFSQVRFRRGIFMARFSWPWLPGIQFRSQMGTFFTGSSLILNIWPLSLFSFCSCRSSTIVSASTTMVRNLYMRNFRPFRPMRGCI